LVLDDHALLAQKASKAYFTFSAACSVYFANQGYTNNYNYVWNFMGHLLWPFNLILYILFRTSFSNEAKVDKQKGPHDLSRSPTQAAYITTGTMFYKNNLAKSNAQTYHWHQHVPETENIINGYKYMYVRNS
jgi:hypothetical protein